MIKKIYTKKIKKSKKIVPVYARIHQKYMKKCINMMKKKNNYCNFYLML